MNIILVIMKAGSTTKTRLRTVDQVRQEFEIRGISVSQWAREMGYSPGLVHQVLGGRLRCLRGQAHEVAVVLGLKSGSIEGIQDLPFSQQRAENDVST